MIESAQEVGPSLFISLLIITGFGASQARLIVQQRDLQLAVGNARVVAADAMQTIDQLAGGFDARESAADNDKVPQPAPQGNIGLELDAGDAAQHHIADLHRVADGLERQGVLRQPGDQVEARAVTEREYQVLAGDLSVAGQVAQVSVLDATSMLVTRPMMKRARVTIGRIGATTCSGKIAAPTASASNGLNVM